ncbi:MAG: hypothetical protein LBQ26_00195, partial [Holosporales bacterium]|nr:hypothetical protein [Holosporales bacterium]
MSASMVHLLSCFLYVGAGLACTLGLLVGGLFIGVALGTLLSVLRYNDIGSAFITAFVSIIRGTPLIL